MATIKNVGIIEKTVLNTTYEESHIEWRIPDFSSVFETEGYLVSYDSPVFIVNSVSWFFELFPKSGPDLKFMRIFIVTKEIREYTLEYNFSLKKLDGSMEKLANGILAGDKTLGDAQKIIKRSEILERRSELTPQNVLTIICTLKREVTHSNEPTMCDKQIPIKLIRLDKLSENFKDLFGDKETCDVTLAVKDTEYKAHRTVLIARSSVFAATFKHDTLERQTGLITIPDCDPDSFQEFLEYLYCGRLEQLSLHNALNLYYTSDKYDIHELKEFCVDCLVHCLTIENVCEIAEFSDKYDEGQLFCTVRDFFIKNSSKILLTSEWEHLMKTSYRLANKLLTEMAKMQLKE